MATLIGMKQEYYIIKTFCSIIFIFSDILRLQYGNRLQGLFYTSALAGVVRHSEYRLKKKDYLFFKKG